jgi:transcriptional regulator of acetoin/glycerol metabolism
LRAALEACNWEIKRCAELLGMDRTTLWRKMKRYGIRRP